jgi:hypothetical protein
LRYRDRAENFDGHPIYRVDDSYGSDVSDPDDTAVRQAGWLRYQAFHRPALSPATSGMPDRHFRSHTACVDDDETRLFEDPLPQAYERVTNPGRFQVLHDAARELVERLARELAVERHDVTEPDPRGRESTVPGVRLTPHSSKAGPLTVVFTAFPGLEVRMGRWYEFLLPACGCDACDDDPQDLIEDLHARVKAFTDGRFRERLGDGRTPWLEFSFDGEDWQEGERERLTRAQAKAARRLGPANTLHWAPWPRRDC